MTALKVTWKKQKEEEWKNEREREKEIRKEEAFDGLDVSLSQVA